MTDGRGRSSPISTGVYHIVNDQGRSNIGIDHDTAQCATESIGHGWSRRGGIGSTTPANR